MTKLEKKLRAALQRFGIGLRPRDTKFSEAKLRVVVAVSGGGDSTAMLDALARLRGRGDLVMGIAVAHLNHQLRGAESDEDEQFVRELASRLELPIFVERIAVGEQALSAKQNLEATARQLRYDFLRRVGERNCADFVLTAHTRDDQAETILMRLLRGAGAGGLHGIHEFLPLGENVSLIRPLLAVTRAEVIEHCEHYGLTFRTDSSNLSADFTRNRVRRELLPMLRTFNPRVEEALARSAQLLTKDDVYLQSLAAEQLVRASNGLGLDIGPLFDQPPTIRRRVLRLWLKTQRGDLRRINFSHIEAMDDLIARGQSGRRTELPGGWLVHREFNELRLTRTTEDALRGALTSVPLRENSVQSFGPFTFKLLRHLPREQASPYFVQDNAACEVVLLREGTELDGLRLRTRTPGEAYPAAGHRRMTKLKTLMIRHKIPLSLRDTYPILTTAEDEIVWAPGLPVAKRFSFDGKETPECALVLAEKRGLVEMVLESRAR